MKLTKQLLTINEVRFYGKMQRSMDDIPVGGTVIYSSIHDKCYKMSTVRKKNDRNATLGLQNGDTIQLGAVVDTTQAAWNEWKDKKITEGLADKIMGAAPKEPKYKVGQVVKYEMDPPQEGGSGTGEIKAYKNGHYIINDKPVNHFEIKKVVKEAEDLNEETICSEAVVVVNRLLAEGKIGTYRPPFSISGNWVNDSKGRSVCEYGDDRDALKDIVKALNAFVATKESITESRNEPDNEKPGRTADKLEVGDVVHISGEVQYTDQVGEIESFGKDKKFVVVKLYGGKGVHSFHSSDVTEENTDHEDDEEEINKFYVAFYETAEERPWIGMVSREGRGKWHEKHFKGEADHRWGQTYMSYLEPADIMSWIYKDYGRHVEIDGPFMTSVEAEDHVRENWGTIKESVNESPEGQAKNAARLKAKEKADFDRMMAGAMSRDEFNKKWKKGKYAEKSGKYKLDPTGVYHNLTKTIDEAVTYTDFDDWKDAVRNSYPAQAKKMRFNGRMEGGKMTVSAEVPGVDRCFGVWDQDEDKGTVLSEDSMSEAFKLKDKVKIVKGPKDCTGKDGFIGEIRTDVSGKKTFTIDYDYDVKTGHAKSVQLKASDIRSLKESTEQLEVINQAHASHGLPKKVFFTGTYEQCIDFMRKHKSLKMDLMYKENGRLASYKL